MIPGDHPKTAEFLLCRQRVTSVNSQKELHNFISESKAIMSSGGFDLRGWESSGDFVASESTVVLGISWNKRTDTLSINKAILDIEIPVIVTKRVILSLTHKIFDPIGITCPIALQPKLILKSLWKEKIAWDVEIQDSRKDEFHKWIKELSLLKELEIPRSLGEGDITLHVFRDASGLAYAAAVFARVEHEGIVSVQLLNAKSRLAPEKTTIPRLELMAATIAVRLAAAVSQSLTRKIVRITYWTDSSRYWRGSSVTCSGEPSCTIG